MRRPRIRAMELREVLADVPAEIEGDPATEISSLAYDSRRVGPGSLFFCVVGERADGHEFAPAARERGAAALVVEHRLDVELPQALVPNVRAAMAPAARAFYGDPTAELRVVGITGTNGKTTTAFLVRHLLEQAGVHTGLLGTVKSVIGGREREVERTTPEAIDLQAAFRAMLEAGDRACAMEVSSHALALGRTEGTAFTAVAFTNLTQDHLDFHADMEDYFRAKRRLFIGADAEGAEPDWRRPEVAVVNIDDPYGARLAAEIEPLYGEGLITVSAAGDRRATLRAEGVDFDAGGSRFRALGRFGELEVATPLPGRFNVANSLVALALAAGLGVDAADAAASLARAERVPGRLEPIDAGQSWAVLVDYAHTPDSLENVLRAAREMAAGRVLCVFGCGGDRDREKRPQMGEIAARLADVAVVTSDNPRSEEPEAIIREILAGIPGDARDDDEAVVVEPDRRKAIARALALAAPGDVVLIAGKGHEQGQEFAGGKKVPFDDRDVAREELRRLLGPRAEVA
jgi:UDP-N-acetylmuramoyl-L-alanyl-D-glutamate--2,6-diaminopimelate ligase